MSEIPLQALCDLDAAGFLPGPGETAEDFLHRVETIRRVEADFLTRVESEGKAVVFDCLELGAEERIPEGLLQGAGAVTWALYRFRAGHIPGFFLTKGVGLLWGGCLLGDPVAHFSVLLLRGVFRDREKWLSYRREELLAHELCHAMRQDLQEPTLEEFFAYRTGNSRLRRYLGNCFVSTWDAWFFLLPMLLLPLAQIVRIFFAPALWNWPFWCIALAWPVWLLYRNHRSRQLVFRAKKGLRRAGVVQEAWGPILFRCTREELRRLGECSRREELLELATVWSRTELRWRIISARFLAAEAVSDSQEKLEICGLVPVR